MTAVIAHITGHRPRRDMSGWFAPLAIQSMHGGAYGTTGSFRDIEHLRSVAHHEAGHAVVAVALGAHIAFATTVPCPRTLGQCEIHHPENASAMRRVAGVLAGPLAECRYTGRAFDLARYPSDAGKVVHFLVTRAGLSEVRALESACYEQALDLARGYVASRWRQIERVAIELIVRCTLTHDDIERAMRQET